MLTAQNAVKEENEWRHVASVHMVNVARSGWAGVWQALKAAITGDPRPMVNREYTIEAFISVKNNKITGGKGNTKSEDTIVPSDIYLDGVKVNGGSKP